MTEDDRKLLKALRADAAETRKLLSNAQKPERERMVVRAFLRCIGEPFTDSEVQSSPEEPVDTLFRNARFQVRDIVGDRKRGKEVAQREQQYERAERISDLLVPWTSSEPISVDNVSAQVADALAGKASRYGPKESAMLDALIYVDLHSHHLYPPEPGCDATVASELERQGWRSVSFLFLPYGVVLAAKLDAPRFLKDRLGRALNEWPNPDGWFEA